MLKRKVELEDSRPVFFQHRGCHLIYQIYTKISQGLHRLGKHSYFFFLYNLIDIDEARCVFFSNTIWCLRWLQGTETSDLPSWERTYKVGLVLTGRSTGPMSLHEKIGVSYNTSETFRPFIRVIYNSIYDEARGPHLVQGSIIFTNPMNNALVSGNPSKSP